MPLGVPKHLSDVGYWLVGQLVSHLEVGGAQGAKGAAVAAGPPETLGQMGALGHLPLAPPHTRDGHPDLLPRRPLAPPPQPPLHVPNLLYYRGANKGGGSAAWLGPGAGWKKKVQVGWTPWG